jgi:hypothetical protein
MNDPDDITGCRLHVDMVACYAMLIIETKSIQQEITITLDMVKVLTYSGNRLLSHLEYSYDYSKGIDLDPAFTPIVKYVTKGLHGIPQYLRQPVRMKDICLPLNEYCTLSQVSEVSLLALCSPVENDSET